MSALNSKFSKIMVAIDGSPDSFKAVEYAIELTKVYGAQLCAVIVTYESKEKRDDMNDAKRWFQDTIS